MTGTWPGLLAAGWVTKGRCGHEGPRVALPAYDHAVEEFLRAAALAVVSGVAGFVVAWFKWRRGRKDKKDYDAVDYIREAQRGLSKYNLLVKQRRGAEQHRRSRVRAKASKSFGDDALDAAWQQVDVALQQAPAPDLRKAAETFRDTARLFASGTKDQEAVQYEAEYETLVKRAESYLRDIMDAKS